MRFNGLLLSVVTFGVYIATLSRNFTAASIMFVTEIESGDWTTILQRQKILLYPTGWVFYQFWRLAGWNDKGLFPLQVFNALFGAISVGLMYSISKRLTHSTPIAFLVSIGFAFSSAVWLFSTEAEFATLPLAAMLMMLWLLLNAPPKLLNHRFYPVLLGGWAGLSFLLYSSNGLLALVAIVGLWFMEQRSWQSRLKQAVVILVSMTLIVGPVYLLVLYFVNGVHDLASLRDWQLYGGQGTGTIYGNFELSHLFYGAYALIRSLSSYPGFGLDTRAGLFMAHASWLEKETFGGYYLFVLAVLLTPLIVAFIKRRQLLLAHYRPLCILAAVAVLYMAFALLWSAKDQKFWLPILAPWWLLVGLLLVTLNEERSSMPSSPRTWWQRVSFNGITAVMIAVLFCINGFGIVVPHRFLELNRAYQIAMSVGEHTSPQDLIITTGGDRLAYYIPYFANRRTLIVFQLFLKAAHNTEDEVFTTIQQEIAQTYERGGRVFLVGTEPGRDAEWDVLEAVQLTPDDFARFKTRPAWTVAGETVLSVFSAGSKVKTN